MIWKLAYKNIKRQIKLYLIYFTSILMGVAGFYGFVSFYYQNLEALSNQKVDYTHQSIFIEIMIIPCVILLLFMVLYGSNFVIKARSKEYGLYRLLGMNRKNFRKLFFFENLILFASIFVLGIVLGQVVKIAVIHLLSQDYETIGVVVSKNFDLVSIIDTFIIFSIIFIINGIVQAIRVTRIKLITLFHAENKQEIVIKHSLKLTIVKFLLSIAILAVDYNLVTVNVQQIVYNSPNFGVMTMVLILISGTYATFLFYDAYSYTFKYFVTNKIKYSNENSFTFSLITKRLSTINKMIAFISLLLLVSLGAFGISNFYNMAMSISIPPNDYIVGCSDCESVYLESPEGVYAGVVLDKNVGMGIDYNSTILYTDSVTDDFNLEPQIYGKDSEEDIKPSLNLSIDASKAIPFDQANELINITKDTYTYDAIVVIDDKYAYDEGLNSAKRFVQLKDEVSKQDNVKYDVINDWAYIRNTEDFNQWFAATTETEYNNYCSTFTTCETKNLEKNQIYLTTYLNNIPSNISSYSKDFKFEIDKNLRGKNIIIFPDENYDDFKILTTTNDLKQLAKGGGRESEYLYVDGDYKQLDSILDEEDNNGSGSIYTINRHKILKGVLQSKIFIISSAVFIGFMFLVVLISMMGLHLSIDGLTNKKEFTKMSKIGYTKKQLKRSINRICLLYFISPIILLVPNLIVVIFMFLRLYNLHVKLWMINKILGVFDLLIVVSIIYIIVALLATKLYKEIVFDVE